MLLLKSAILIIILILACYTDIQRMEIDDEPTILGLAFITLFSLAGLNDVSTIDSVFGFLLGGGVFTLLAFWGMGGGDIKLMALIGFFLGWHNTLLVMYVTFVLGAVMGIGYVFVLRKKLKDYIPLAPAIALATVITMFCGSWITSHMFSFSLFS